MTESVPVDPIVLAGLFLCYAHKRLPPSSSRYSDMPDSPQLKDQMGRKGIVAPRCMVQGHLDMS